MVALQNFLRSLLAGCKHMVLKAFGCAPHTCHVCKPMCWPQTKLDVTRFDSNQICFCRYIPLHAVTCSLMLHAAGHTTPGGCSKEGRSEEVCVDVQPTD